MSPRDSSEQRDIAGIAERSIAHGPQSGLARLRRAIARIEGGGATDGGRSQAALRSRESLSGEPALENHVSGGLHEIIPSAHPDLFAAMSFAFGLAAACARARPHAGLVLITEDFVALETGAPYGPGLACAGLDPARVLIVRTQSPDDTLRAMETALRCKAVACVVAESALPPRRYDLATSRRLLLAARAGGGAGIFLPVALAGHAGRVSSAASLRFEVARARSKSVEFGRMPIPGPMAFGFRLLKAPGALARDAALSRDVWREKVFAASGGESRESYDEAAYHAFSVDPFSLSRDRPHPARRSA